MSIEGKTPAEAGTPAYITRFDGVRVPATDYGHPAGWTTWPTTSPSRARR